MDCVEGEPDCVCGSLNGEITLCASDPTWLDDGRAPVLESDFLLEYSFSTTGAIIHQPSIS